MCFSGDCGASCLAVVLPTLSTLEVLDLEGCGITQYGANVSKGYLLNMLQAIYKSGFKQQKMSLL